MLAIVGDGLELTKRDQIYLMLESLKNQSFESKSVKEELLLPMKAYTAYKINYGKNTQIDPFADNFCKYEVSASSPHSISSLGQIKTSKRSLEAASLPVSLVLDQPQMCNGPDVY